MVGTDNKKVALFTFPEVKFFSVPCNAILNKVNIERIFTSTIIWFKREILRFFENDNGTENTRIYPLWWGNYLSLFFSK
jgi:hypothetical protein